MHGNVILINPPFGSLKDRISPPPPTPAKLWTALACAAAEDGEAPPAPAAAPGHSFDGQQGLQIMLQQDHADSLARARLTGALFAEARSYYQSIE